MTPIEKTPRIPSWLFGIALIVRVFVLYPVLVHPSIAVRPDSIGYIQLAKNIWLHHSFSADPEPPYRPDTFRTMGYPLYLLPIVNTFHEPIRPIAIGQVIIGLWTLLIVWRWLLAIVGPKFARWGTLILAVDPVIVLHTPYALSETLFYFFLVLAADYTWRTLKEENPVDAAQAGFLWGISILVRPVSLYLPIVLTWLPKGNRARAVFLVASYCLPGLWVIRNIESAHLSSYSSMGGIHMLRCFAAGEESVRTHRDYGEVDAELEGAVDNQHPGGYTNDVEQSTAYKNAALPYIKAHPFYVLEFCAKGAILTLGGHGFDMLVDLWMPDATSSSLAQQANTPQIAGHGTRKLLHRHPALIPFLALYWAALGLLYAGYLLGIVHLWRHDRYRQALYLFLAPAYFLGVTSHAGYYRHRISMMPFLVIGFLIFLTGFVRGKDNASAESA